MDKTRYVRFDFFTPTISSYEMIEPEKTNGKRKKKKVKKLLDTKPFDFIGWMSNLKKVNKADRIIHYQQEKIRVDQIYVDQKTEYGVVHFTRMRETNVPAITQELVDELADIGLKDNEYIAEDVSCIYDSELNVLMVQRNVYSLSPTGIEYYINNFNDDENTIVELSSICYEKAFARGKNKGIYRTINLKTGDIRKHPSLFSMDNPISRAFKELQGLDGYDIEITVKTSREKKSKLDKQRVESVLSDFEKEKEFLTKAEIGFKESDEAKVEKIDLLKGKIFVFLPFNIQPKKTLNQDVVQTDMINKYCGVNGMRKVIIANR
ncbi:DUF6731 family protein [Enterococcus avium]|uniref:DUF6731 family protein n=1 Tax=Enterococcus avium TaxID=33945 RepID=UPI002890D2C7|nr:DUF6731 family protein [Enterococcus avium]MDT2390970.1 hypothetical protein [Enterococcus avium]